MGRTRGHGATGKGGGGGTRGGGGGEGGGGKRRGGLSSGLGVAGSAALGSLIQGYTTGCLGGSLLFLVPHFGLTPPQVGAIATATTLGSVVGTLTASKLADGVGRRNTMLCSAVVFVAAGGLLCWTPSVSALIFARALVGVGVGNAGAVVPIYVAECAEPALRGALSTVPQLFISSGVLLAYVVTLAVAVAQSAGATLLEGPTAFRATLGFVLLPACAYLACVLRLPESPRFLLRRGDVKAAENALSRLRGRGRAAECALELEAMRAAIEEETASASKRGTPRGGSSWASLREPAIAKTLAVCVALQVLQQLSGINAVVYYTPQILKTAGVPRAVASFVHGITGDRLPLLNDDAAAMLATALAYAPKVPAYLLTAALMDKWGRRRLLRSFTPAMAACLAALAFALNSMAAPGASPLLPALALAAISLFGVSFGLSLGPIPNILTAESFPTRARSAAMTVSLTAQFACHTLVSYGFPTAVAKHGAPAVFAGFAAVAAAAWLFTSVFVAETKQASLEELSKRCD